MGRTNNGDFVRIWRPVMSVFMLVLVDMVMFVLVAVLVLVMKHAVNIQTISIQVLIQLL